MSKNTNVREKPDLDTPRKQRDIGALEALWVFFSSMKTAITLLLILAVASVAGTIVPQNQPPDAYIKAYGQAKYSIIKALNLSDVYHSTWFVVLLGLIGINLAVCSINRFGTAWRKTFQPDVDTDPQRVAGMARSETIAFGSDPASAVARAADALRQCRYHVLQSVNKDRASIYASKGRLSVWGPYLTHVSILVIFLGAILGGVMGFEGYTMIDEGGRVSSYQPRGSDQTKPLGFSVGLGRFTIAHDKRRNPTGYKSDLTVYDGGAKAAHKVIDVNHPLTYKGISFFQSGYGLSSMVVKVTGPSGQSKKLTFELGSQDTPQGTAYGIVGQVWQQVKLGDKKLTVFAHNLVPDYVGGKRINASTLPLNPAASVMVNERFPEYRGLDAWKSLGWLAQGESAGYKGYSVSIEKITKYTGLQVSSNPALPIIYFGFALMVIGVFVSFYVSHRIIRVSISSSGGGSEVAVGATSRADPEVFDKDLDRLREALS